MQDPLSHSLQNDVWFHVSSLLVKKKFISLTPYTSQWRIKNDVWFRTSVRHIGVPSRHTCVQSSQTLVLTRHSCDCVASAGTSEWPWICYVSLRHGCVSFYLSIPFIKKLFFNPNGVKGLRKPNDGAFLI